MIERIEHTPIALFGCPLGFLGLTLATLHIETSHSFPHFAGGVLLACTLTLFTFVFGAYVGKGIRSPMSVLSDWNHPVRCNFFAVISGTFALFGLAFLPFHTDTALYFWYVGTVAQIAVTLGILSRWFGPQVFEVTTLSPAQFLPAVGNVLIPLAGVPLGYAEVSWFFFSVGLVLWLVLMPILIGRLLSHVAPPDGLVPTLVIFIAPPTLLMLTHLRLDPDAAGISKFFYYISLLLFMVVLTQIPRFARLPFSLAWWAYTFPLGAFTIGTLTFAEMSGLDGFRHFGTLLYGALLAIFLMVSWNTLRSLFEGQVFLPDP